MGKEPLHLGALLAFSQGRWNRQGEYAAIYTACTPDGARAEWIKLCATAGSAVGPRDLVSIDVVVAPTYDLTDRTAYRASTGRAGITPHPKFFTDMDAVPYDHCQALADQARTEGFTALLVPSAAAKQETNLVIYFDVVAPRHVQIENGPDRLPLR